MLAHTCTLPKHFFGFVWQIIFLFVTLQTGIQSARMWAYGFVGHKVPRDGVPTEVSEPLILLAWRKSMASRRLMNGSHKGRLQTLVFCVWKSGKFQIEIQEDNAAKRPRGWFTHRHLHCFRIYVYCIYEWVYMYLCIIPNDVGRLVANLSISVYQSLRHGISRVYWITHVFFVSLNL